MRKILFRGKPKSNNEYYCFSQIWRDFCKNGFVYGSLIVKEDRYFICVSTAGVKMNCCINNSTVSMIEVIPETIGQYTGLTKIFEGDICLCKRNISHYMDNLAFEIKHDSICNFFGESASGNTITADEFYLCEIIGNIHDNPELLKEANLYGKN